MDYNTFLKFFENISMFTLLTLIIVVFLMKLKIKENYKKILFGLYFTIVSIGAMVVPIEVSKGIIFDARFLLTAFSGYIGGPISGGITILLVSLYRIKIGGMGTLPGLIGIVSSGVIGVLSYQFTKKTKKNVRYFIIFGTFTAIATIGPFVLNPLPRDIWWAIALKLIYTIPFTTVVASCVIGLTIEHEVHLNKLLNIIKKEKEVSDHLAYYDKLTKAPNRNSVISRMNQLMSDNIPFYITFIDLDNFKSVNDTHGHDVGDEILIAFAAVLEKFVNEGNSFYGRVGGDEFVIGFINHTKDECNDVLKKLVDAIDNPFILSKISTRMYASMGVAMFPNDANTLSDLFKLADIVMYECKSFFGTIYKFYENRMFEAFERQLKIEEYLRKANIEKEFSICLQPQMCIDCNEPSGFEALLRWKNPVLGNISPYEFIPIAESVGYISNLGKFVIERACDSINQLNKAHNKKYSITINTSSYELSNPHYTKYLQSIINKYDLDYKFVEVEITERIIIEMNEVMHENIRQLSDLGIRIALDDFGTGLSSIQSLKKLAFSTVKIDKEFIQNTSSFDKQLLSSMIAMLKVFNVDIIAEGVETKAQYTNIVNNNINIIQGYYTGKPMDLKLALTKYKKSI